MPEHFSLTTEPLSSDAHWLTLDELTYRFHRDRLHTYSNPWPRIGTYQEQPIYLSHDRWNCHIFAIDPGTSSVPSLARLLANVNDPGLSLIFFDPDSKLKRHLADRLELTHTLLEIAPTQPETGLTYNPLAHLLQPDISNPDRFQDSLSRQERQADLIATLLVDRLAVAHSSHYTGTRELAISLLQACILHLCTTSNHIPFPTLASLLKDRHRLLIQLEQSPISLTRTITNYLKGLGRTYLDILLDILAPISTFLERREVQTLTRYNQLSFADLLNKPVALFFTFPTTGYHQPTLSALTALFFAQMTHTLAHIKQTDHAANRGTRIVVNQAELVPTLPGLLQWLSWWPDTYYNMSFVLGTRSRDAFVKRYRDGDDILNNIGTHIIFSGAELADCQTYSRYCGQTSTGPLITPEEVHNLTDEHMLFCPADVAPMVVTLS